MTFNVGYQNSIPTTFNKNNERLIWQCAAYVSFSPYKGNIFMFSSFDAK